MPSKPLWSSTRATAGACSGDACRPSSTSARRSSPTAGAPDGTGSSTSSYRVSHVVSPGAATRSYDINTAAVILEAAAYRRLGRPFLPRAALNAPAR